MDEAYKLRLEANLRRYAWMKTFTKRVYFPVTSIMLVHEAHLSLAQIGTIGAAAALAQGLFQLPSGYLADKIGNRKTMLLGAIISAPATLFYIFMPNFWGGLLGLLVYTIGLAFISGAGEAFMHDTLVALGRARDYAKEVGRAQSIALGGNFVLVSLVPLTYAIDYRLPFLVGFICAIFLVFSIVKMLEPNVRKTTSQVSPLDAMRKIVTWQNFSLFLFAGLTGGVVERVFDFLPLALVGVGIPDFSTGIVVAISSLLGAVLGWYIHIFDRLKPMVFYVIDLILVTGLLGLEGVSNAFTVVICFVAFLGYVRVRYIVFQSKLLQDLQHGYKATLVSTLGFFGVVGGVFTMMLFGNITSLFGFNRGLIYFSGIVFVIGLALLFVVMSTRTKPLQVGEGQ